MLIGLMGYAGVGKSTVARILCERHGFTAPHLAAPFKAMFGALLHQMAMTAVPSPDLSTGI